MDKKLGSRPLTLTEADISSKRVVTRRSMLSALGLGLGAAAAAIAGPERAAAQSRGCTDGDSGPSGDPIDYGTRCQPRATQRNGCTDNDSGPREDQPGSGTRCWI